MSAAKTIDDPPVELTPSKTEKSKSVSRHSSRCSKDLTYLL